MKKNIFWFVILAGWAGLAQAGSAAAREGCLDDPGWYRNQVDQQPFQKPLSADETRRRELMAQAEELAATRCDSLEAVLAMLYAGKTF